MKIFDWVPTIPEVMDYIECRIVGHDFTYIETKDGARFVCKICGKVNENNN